MPNLLCVTLLSLLACTPAEDEVKFDTAQGGADTSPTAEDADGDGYLAEDDCDDADPEVNAGVAEVCDEIDNDCDSFVDASDPDIVGAQTWYEDADADGHGDDQGDGVVACSQPGGYVAASDDCDDADPDISPDEQEVCDDVDNDCDALVDDEDDDRTGGLDWYQDDDRDGYGTPGVVARACDQTSGLTLNDTDCDDTDVEVNVGASEVCDDVDNDCDGLTDGQDDDVVGDALHFDGSDYVVVPASDSFPSGDAPRTLMFEVRAFDRTTVNMVTFGSGLVRNSRWSILLESTQLKVVGEYNDYYFSDHVGTSWIHVAVVYDGASLFLYENGVLIETETVTTPFATDNSYELIFGSDSLDRADEYLDGDLSEIRAWNRALTESEVVAELASGTADPTDLIGQWPLDEGTGTTVADVSGNGHDGTIVGATWSGCSGS